MFCCKTKKKNPRDSSLVINVEVNEDENEEVFGGEKDISFFGGVTLLTNNITGPGNDAIFSILFQLTNIKD
jgi:hypothetical protein